MGLPPVYTSQAKKETPTICIFMKYETLQSCKSCNLLSMQARRSRASCTSYQLLVAFFPARGVQAGFQEAHCTRAEDPLDRTQCTLLFILVDDPEMAPFFCGSHASSFQRSFHGSSIMKSKKVDICSCWWADGPIKLSRHSW